MLVDVVFPGWVPFVYLAIAEDVVGFIKAHDIALMTSIPSLAGIWLDWEREMMW